MNEPTIDRTGRVYVKPVSRGIHFVSDDNEDESYIEELIEQAIGTVAKGKPPVWGWSGYATIRLRVDVLETEAD